MTILKKIELGDVIARGLTNEAKEFILGDPKKEIIKMIELKGITKKDGTKMSPSEIEDIISNLKIL